MFERDVPHPYAPSPEVLFGMAAALASAVGHPIAPAHLLADITPWIGPCLEGQLFDTGRRFISPKGGLPRRRIKVGERRELARSFLTTCFYCRRKGSTTRDADDKKWLPDHYIPKSRGGSCHPANIVLACCRCNDDKWDDLWLPGTTEALIWLPGTTVPVALLPWLNRPGDLRSAGTSIRRS